MAFAAHGDVVAAHLAAHVPALADLESRLRAYRAGDTLELAVFRGDELLTTPLRLADSPTDTCYLTLDADADATAKTRRDAWLQIE